MKEDEKSENNRIELRSEKLRELICGIPDGLYRTGWIILIFVILALVVATVVVEIPYSEGKNLLEIIVDKTKF